MTLSKQTFIIIVGLLFCLSLLSALDWEFKGLQYEAAPLSKASSSVSKTTPQSPQKTCRVVQVFDGDTVECVFEATPLIPRHREHIRLLGIDAPESKHSYKNKTGVDAPFSKAAAKRLTQLTMGKTIRLDYDVRPYDRYGRTLAFIYSPASSSTSVNETLVKEGLVVVRVIPPNVTHETRYKDLEREAKRARRGLWESP